MLAKMLGLMCTSLFMLVTAEAAPFAYVTNPNADTVTVIDIATNTIVGAIPVGRRPLYLAATPDGARLYVVNRGDMAPDNRGNVSVIDTATNTVTTDILLDIGFPFQIAVAPDGTRAYVAVSQGLGDIISGGANRVDVINTATNAVEASITIPGDDPFGPMGLAITPDGRRLYVTNRGSGTLVEIDTESNTVTASIPVSDSRPTGIAITPDGTRAYVANRGPDRSVMAFDIDPGSPTFRQLIAFVPVSFAAAPVTFVGITSNGRRAYVTYTSSNRILVINTDPTSPFFNSPIQRIDTGAGALSAVAFTPDGRRAYVASSYPNRVLVVDVDPESENFHTVIATLTLGERDAFDVVIIPNR